jgi:hypothetical protein
LENKQFFIYIGSKVWTDENIKNNQRLSDESINIRRGNQNNGQVA